MKTNFNNIVIYITLPAEDTNYFVELSEIYEATYEFNPGENNYDMVSAVQLYHNNIKISEQTLYFHIFIKFRYHTTSTNNLTSFSPKLREKMLKSTLVMLKTDRKSQNVLRNS